MFKLKIFETLLSRVQPFNGLIQVLSGPRQVGKTTLIKQLIQAIDLPVHYASADEPTIQPEAWISQQWELARIELSQSKQGAVLVLDEVQKIRHWSSYVKQLWDEDRMLNNRLSVVILGSSPLLLQQGLSESLAGRFETILVTHWAYQEMRAAFSWDIDEYIYFGGYPGAASLIADEARWKAYIIDSLIETSISRDIFLMSRVDKPALLRQLFQLGCHYSAQILSYQKMLGQLDDAGNTTTLSHYLRLLSGAGLLTGLEKFSTTHLKQRASSPKLQVLNTALITAQQIGSLITYKKDREFWGRLLESAVGAYLVNQAKKYYPNIEVTYWRERQYEVDFVLQWGDQVIAIEVKSGTGKRVIPGVGQFIKRFPQAKPLLIGGQGMPVEQFFLTPINKLFH